MAQGKTNADVGGMLNISTGTVRKYLEHIYQKLDVDNRGAATYCALETLGMDGVSSGASPPGPISASDDLDR